MWTEILILDVTQMNPTDQRVCVAGVDKHWKYIRLDLPAPGITRSTLHQLTHDGASILIRPQAVITVSVTPKKKLTAPHLEDHDWYIERGIKSYRLATHEKFYNALNQLTFPTVESIFKVKFPRNRNVPKGNGACSLGVIKPVSVQSVEFKFLELYQKQGYKISFTDGQGERYQDITITDLSLQTYVKAQHANGKPFDQIALALQQIFSTTPIWLCLGLTREYQGHHWLQVSGIYTEPDYLEGRCFADYDHPTIEQP
ncbi:MAG: hypothetical protein MUF87_06005 [Anaerolineae bacterium]|jgi:hypothetical protein|nr:hypothetical protein [Anaerolineae bacterium]